MQVTVQAPSDSFDL